MSSPTLATAWRFAKRELRGGTKGFRLFMACLFLGVCSIAAVESVAASLLTGLQADARAIMGGDVRVARSQELLEPEMVAWMTERAQVSQVTVLRSMAGSDTERMLVELKGVDDGYPLVGSFETDPPYKPGNGLWVDPDVLRRLGVEVGDTLKIGTANLPIAGIIEKEPDRQLRGIQLGPKVILSHEALAATELVQPGSLVRYGYRAVLPPRTNPETWAESLEAAFPDTRASIRTFRESSPGFRRFVNRLSHFLTLVGLTALLVGGVGISNAVRGYLDTKMPTIATLKCLGAPTKLVTQTYLLQIAVLAAVGIALGLVVGAVAPFLVIRLAGDALPVAAETGLYPAPLLTAAAFGALTALVFTLVPLARIQHVRPASLFRSRIVPSSSRMSGLALAVVVAACLLLVGLALLQSNHRLMTLGFVGGVAASFGIFAGLARGTVAIAKRIKGLRIPEMRLAVANLHRPGSPTVSIVLSLGLGFTVLSAIALVEGNLDKQLSDELPDQAPAFFFADIQSSQAEAFDETLNAIEGVSEINRVPMLRGRIVEIDGVPVGEASVAPEARWAVDRDRGITYLDAPPTGSEVVEGEWWPQGYEGEPLVSFDERLASGMGLSVGDSLTLEILGRKITATIANLRDINWRSMGINFAIVLNPHALAGAPHTHLATAHTTPQAENAVFDAVSDALPNVSAIRVREAMEQARELIGHIAAVIRIAALFTLLAGIFVLAGGMLATHQRRVYDAVVLKVLGATRKRVTATFLAEYGVLSVVTAILASALGAITAWAILTQLMDLSWTLLGSALVQTLAVCVVVTLSVGIIATWRALSQKAAPLLRNE